MDHRIDQTSTTNPQELSSVRQRLMPFGCCAAIVALTAMHHYIFIPGVGRALLLMSIGASTVLIFGAPLSPFSSVRAVLGGHTISALIGVSCALWIPFEPLAAGAAVGLSLGAMRLCRCVHPPAGSSALLAVMGGESIRALGFAFIFNPVILNAAMLCLLAAIWNRAIKVRLDPER